MTVTQYLDTKLETGTHEYILQDKYGNIVSAKDYDNLIIHNVNYRKVAIITVL